MTITEMTADLVHAIVRQRKLSADNLSKSLHAIHGTLLSLALKEPMPEGTPPTETVDWHKSIRLKSITCLQCGQAFRQLSNAHLRCHGLDPLTYRTRYGIPRETSLSARELTQRRRQIMKELRPWELSPSYRKRTDSK
jgi:predicted transcriptional regulator